jgi:hypothetical protein
MGPREMLESLLQKISSSLFFICLATTIEASLLAQTAAAYRGA